MGLREDVLAKLQAKSGKDSKKGPSRFSGAAQEAWDAVKSDNFGKFEKALDAAMRIKLAEKD